jgi:hypothetical protein
VNTFPANYCEHGQSHSHAWAAVRQMCGLRGFQERSSVGAEPVPGIDLFAVACPVCGRPRGFSPAWNCLR